LIQTKHSQSRPNHREELRIVALIFWLAVTTSGLHKSGCHPLTDLHRHQANRKNLANRRRFDRSRQRDQKAFFVSKAELVAGANIKSKSKRNQTIRNYKSRL